MSKETHTKTQVIATLDKAVAEWLAKRYDGTNKKSWFMNEAIKRMICHYEEGYIELEHEGNNHE